MTTLIKRQCSKSQPCNHESSIKTTPYIGYYTEAPKYTLDNKFLLTGYRVNYNTISLAISNKYYNLESAFQIHNETCNIWSHFIPLLIYLMLLIHSEIYQIAPFISFMKESPNHFSDIQLWPLQYCLLCAVILFTISSIYHTFFCVNSTLSCVLLRYNNYTFKIRLWWYMFSGEWRNNSYYLIWILLQLRN